MEDLSPLGGLASLDLSWNNLADLSGLDGLSGLQELNASNNSM